MSESGSVPAGDVVVRRAAARDSEDAVRLLHDLGYDRAAGGVEHDLRTGGAGVVYVVDSGGRIVGLLAMSVRRQFHWGAMIASVDALVIDRAYRSRGVGASLLDAAVDHAKRDGCILIELHSNRRRRRAHQFYKRQGFESTSAYFVKRLR